MLHVKKGNKIRFDGVLLTKTEYKQYKKLNNMVNLFKTYKKNYDAEFRSSYM